MMVPLDALPALIKLLGDTEQVLHRITGLHIKLRMEVADSAVTNQQALYLMLQEAICHSTGLSWSQLLVKNRRSHLVLARQAYCWYARHAIGGRTLGDIGNDLGGLDHTTVIHSIRVFDELLQLKDTKAVALLHKIQKRMQHEGKANQTAV